MGDVAISGPFCGNASCRYPIKERGERCPMCGGTSVNFGVEATAEIKQHPSVGLLVERVTGVLTKIVLAGVSPADMVSAGQA